METSGLNTLDIIVISLQFLSAVIAFFRGFVREVLSLFAWIGAFIVAIYGMDTVAVWLAPHIATPIVAKGVAAAGTYIAALIGLSLINMLILRAMSQVDIGFLDRSLGFLFGLLRGVFIIALAHLTFIQLVAEKDYPDLLTQAKTRRLIEFSSTMLASMAPSYARELSEITQEAANGNMKGLPLEGLQASALEGILKDASPRGLAQGNRETLKSLLSSLPADRLLYYASELARTDASKRNAYLADIVASARRDKTPEQLYEMDLSQQQLDALEKALAKSAGNARDAAQQPAEGGYKSRQVKDMDRLIEGLQ